MQKILYIITQSNWGGAQKYVYDLATNLKDEFDITVACGSGGDLVKRLNKNGIKTIVVSDLVRKISPLKDLRCLFQLYKIIKNGKFDIVHTNSSKAEILGNLAARLAGTKKIIFTAHGFVFNEPLSGFKKRFYIFLEKFANRFSSKVIAVSEFDRKSAIDKKIVPESKIITVYHGLDLKRFNSLKTYERRDLNIQKNSIIVGTVSNFYSVKGLKYLIKSAAKVLDEYPDTFFLIIGDGQQREKIENQIKKLKIEGKIILTGFRDDALDLLHAMDIFVISSLKEGFPYSLLEAMASGIPIVATKVGGIPEAIKDGQTGFLVEPADSDSLAKAIEKLIRNRDLRKKMSENLKEESSEYYLTKMLEKTKQIYL